MAAENKMGVMPVGKLLVTMALPMIASMLVQALYNIVDSIFVAMISEEAFTAVSIAFTIQNLMMAVASGLGVGINALLSRSLGQKDFKMVNRAATNGILLEVIGCLVFIILGFVIVEPFYTAQAGTGPEAAEIIRYGKEYLTLVLVMSFGVFGQFTFERLLQATGKTMFTMTTQGTGAIINLILDPIFMFVFDWGVAGAALATVTGQCVAATMAAVFNVKKNKEINLSFKGFKPHGNTIGQILKVGVPSTIMISIGSVMTFCMNKILVAFSSTAVAVFGAYFKLNSFIMMPLFGMNNSLVPIVSYNYGAGRKDRMVKAIKLALIYAFTLMVAGMLIFQFIPGPLLGFFNASPEMLRIGIPALRIIALSFPVASFCIIFSSVFQAVGNGVYSMLTSFARQLVALIPSAYIIARTVNFSLDKINYVWWSYNIAEVVSITLSVILFVRLYNTRIKNIKPIED